MQAERPIHVLYTDPPWWYNNRKTGGERKKSLIVVPDKEPKFGGGARKHYPLMKDADLLALAPLVEACMAENSICLMWATSPRLDFAIELLQAWGFRYATVEFSWIKLTKDGTRPKYGPGTYTASCPEWVLLGVKGKEMTPKAWGGRQMTPSIIMTPWLGHSVKPRLHRLIDRMYPGGRKMEMFARQPAHRWEAIGNAISGMDIKEELTHLANTIQGSSYQQLSLV